MIQYLLKILIFIFSICSINSKLYQVYSVSRHGARYHLHYYGNASQTKEMEGQLTSVGMRQHQKLGSILRKEYVDGLNFLSSSYNASEIEVYTTPINRTMESIQSQLYGLYPPGTGPRITFIDRQWHLPPYSNKTDISQQNYALPSAYQPIKVSMNQKILVNNCPNYEKYAKKNLQLNADDVQEMTTTYRPFLNKLASMYNFSTQNSSMLTFLELYDVANVDQHLGRPWPNGFTNDDFQNLRHLANWYYYITLGGDNTYMINSGKFQRIISLFDTRTRVPKSSSVKWSFMSAHDTDVMAMHLALNLSSSRCTEELYRKGSTSALNCQQGGNSFASNLIIQLHSDDQIMFYVKVRSNGKYVKLCGKDSVKCDYYTFKTQVKKFIVSNLEELCGKKIQEDPNFIKHQENDKQTAIE